MSKELPQEDPSLIERLRDPAQCREAFTEVMRRYSEPLYWQIRRMVNNHEDANDLLQNTFMKAWQALDNFRGDARLTTWLYKIAINESLTHLEKDRKRQGVSLDDDETGIVNTIEADEWIDGDELSLKLRKAIARLPEKQRIVFNMKYFDEMKYEDMSSILGTSVGALKASYHLAVKKIEQYLEEE
ncbi:MAG: sigma-70 family RNA polymerase sigma factor [Muribaculaceae bacterium]|nr:sigma-70 family RNA polymerase sigma factor [Muribaculaceae bacterium]